MLQLRQNLGQGFYYCNLFLHVEWIGLASICSISMFNILQCKMSSLHQYKFCKQNLLTKTCIYSIHIWNGVGCIISCCCIGLFVCLFVFSLLVIVRSLRMSVTINWFLSSYKGLTELEQHTRQMVRLRRKLGISQYWIEYFRPLLRFYNTDNAHNKCFGLILRLCNTNLSHLGYFRKLAGHTINTLSVIKTTNCDVINSK